MLYNKALEHLYVTYPAILFFANGQYEQVEITVRKKRYWIGQLERQIRDEWNKRTGVKVARVKLFANRREGGTLVRDNMVINV